MIHEMKLAPLYFDKIKSKEKTVEVRLFDEKRKQLAVGDIIRFYKSDSLDNSLLARITGIYPADSFTELFKTEIFKKCGFGELSSYDAVLLMREFYSETDEKRYGACGIEIEIIP